MRRPDLHAFGERVLRLPGATLSLRILTDIARGDITDRAMTLAAQAFTSILPIVILLLTLPGSDVVDDALSGLGIPVSKLDHNSVDNPQSFATFGIIGALMTIAGATSLSRALGRMYVAIWGVTDSNSPAAVCSTSATLPTNRPSVVTTRSPSSWWS